jgi:glyoxylase-like metal-dependent hydrolase (beta-lactamase superfamily II)
MAAAEWAPYARGETVKAASGPEVIGQFAATDLTLIDDGAEVFPGVTALVTPGHSPGHTSYVITGSTGTRVIALGDIFHIPAQIAHPQWPSLPDFDGEGVLAARGRLLGELRRPGTVGFACHFGDRAFGRIKPDEDGRPGWEPVPAAVLGPPPRLLD